MELVIFTILAIITAVSAIGFLSLLLQGQDAWIPGIILLMAFAGACKFYPSTQDQSEKSIEPGILLLERLADEGEQCQAIHGKCNLVWVPVNNTEEK